MNTSLIRARARENLRNNWGLSLGVALLAALFGALHTSANVDMNIQLEEYVDLPPRIAAVMFSLASFAGTLNLLQLILGGTVQLGYTRYLLNQHDGQELDVKLLFSQFDRFSQGFLQALLRGIFIALWSLLLVIPGIVKAYSYAMTPYIMIDHPEMDARTAIKASMELMDGHKFDLFVLELTFIGWMLLNVLTLGIGSLWLNPYMNAAHAAFYRQIQAEQRCTTVEF